MRQNKESVLFMLSGKQGSGKTTLANLLAEYFAEAEICKFADPLYLMHDTIWEIIGEYGVLQPEKKSGDLLQMLGDFGRSRDKDFFVKCAQSWVRRRVGLGMYLINDDTRFENEFLAFDNIPNLRVIKIRLECDRDLRKERCPAWRENENHASETGLDQWAAEGKFEIYLNSAVRTPRQMLEGVLKFENDFDALTY